MTQGDIQIQFFRTKVSTYSGFDPIWTQLWYHASLPIATGIVLLSFYRKDNLLTDTQTAIAPNIQSHSVYLETDWHVCSFIVKTLNAGNVRWKAYWNEEKFVFSKSDKNHWGRVVAPTQTWRSHISPSGIRAKLGVNI